MKLPLLHTYCTIFILLLCSEVRAQDTTSTGKDNQVARADSSRTFIQKTQRFYNRQFYRFYGRFVSNKINYDTNYIRKYNEYIVTSVGIDYPYLTYNITPDGNGASTDYKANLSNVVGIKFGYKNIGFGFSHKLKSTLENSEHLTSTSYSAFNFKIQTNRFNHVFFISSTKGLTDVSSDQNKQLGKDGYIKRDDIIIYNLSYDFTWNLHWKKYSYVAPITFGQRQIKSMAGFLIKSGLVINEFKADSSIINPSQRSNYSGFKDINHFYGLALEIAPGVGGNFVISKRVYFSHLLFLGMDYYMYNYTHTGSSEAYRSSSVQLFFDVESSIGYQSERAFVGLHVEWKGFYNQILDASMLWYNAYIGLHAGYRIKAPKLLQKAYNVLFPY